jgi:hypothetical protein
MITAIVEFTLPKTMTLDEARTTLLSTAPKYLDMPGLVRKYYFLSEDGAKAGGIYLWQSRAHAERVYTDEWRAFVRGKYGTDPVLSFLACPVVVDNLTHEIVSD